MLELDVFYGFMWISNQFSSKRVPKQEIYSQSSKDGVFTKQKQQIIKAGVNCM